MRGWILGPLVSLLAVGLSFVLLEAGARRFVDAAEIPFPQPRATDDAPCVAPSLTRGYAPIPGVCGFNRDGYLGPIVTLEEGAARPLRILLAGDSIGALGFWAERMESGISARLGREVRVINASVTGYNLCQDWMTLRELAPLTRPDMLVVQSCVNDMIGSLVLLPTNGGRLRLETGGGDAIDLPEAILRSTLLTYLAVRYGASQMSERLKGGRNEGDATRCLAGIKALSQSLGVPARVLLFPELVGPDEEGPWGVGFDAALEMEGQIREASHRVGLETVELRPALEAAGPMPSFRPGPGDRIHPNRAGQSIIAEALAEALSEALREEGLGGREAASP